MDREPWREAVHGLTKSWTQLNDWTELILTNVRWHHIVVLVCISMIMSNIEQILYIYLPFYLEKHLCRSSVHFLNWVVCFLLMLLTCVSFLYVLEIEPLLVASLQIFSLQSVGCLFVLLMIFFTMQKVINLIRYHLFIYIYIFFIFSQSAGWPSTEQTVFSSLYMLVSFVKN